MKVSEIETLPEVKEAAKVLHSLEQRGLKEAAIAAGWTRTLISGGSTSDIDVSYVGPIHYEKAQEIFADVLHELGVNSSKWDIKGVWNAELAYGVKHTVDNFKLYYLNSIDSVYLASDGRLHDPTGHGFEDAKTKTLRINEYDLINRSTTASEEVNVCLENCRRLAKFGWHPTGESVQRIKNGVARWDELNDTEKAYFIKKLGTKYKAAERSNAQRVYSKYGWGFIFDAPAPPFVCL